jgi:hypothetical protein
MLDTVGDLVSGLVELVARGVFAACKAMFRWEASAVRPAWVRVVAIAIIVCIAAAMASVLFTLFAVAFYILLAIAVVGALLAALGAG